MSVEKKSLMSTRAAAKKAVVARSSGSKITAATAKSSPAKKKSLGVASLQRRFAK